MKETAAAVEPCDRCKFLYNRLENQNRNLQKRVNELEAELEVFRSESRWEAVKQEKASREALTTRVNDLEKDIRQYEDIRKDYDRIKSENEALIRLISKLAKDSYLLK